MAGYIPRWCPKKKKKKKNGAVGLPECSAHTFCHQRSASCRNHNLSSRRTNSAHRPSSLFRHRSRRTGFVRWSCTEDCLRVAADRERSRSLPPSLPPTTPESRSKSATSKLEIKLGNKVTTTPQTCRGLLCKISVFQNCTDQITARQTMRSHNVWSVSRYKNCNTTCTTCRQDG